MNVQAISASLASIYEVYHSNKAISKEKLFPL